MEIYLFCSRLDWGYGLIADQGGKVVCHYNKETLVTVHVNVGHLAAAVLVRLPHHEVTLSHVQEDIARSPHFRRGELAPFP